MQHASSRDGQERSRAHRELSDQGPASLRLPRHHSHNLITLQLVHFASSCGRLEPVMRPQLWVRSTARWVSAVTAIRDVGERDVQSDGLPPPRLVPASRWHNLLHTNTHKVSALPGSTPSLRGQLGFARAREVCAGRRHVRRQRGGPDQTAAISGGGDRAVGRGDKR